MVKILLIILNADFRKSNADGRSPVTLDKDIKVRGVPNSDSFYLGSGADEKFLYKDLSYKIIGCFYEVYNELGPAHKEQIYHEALKISFLVGQVKYEDNKGLKIKFKNKDIGVYKPDFIIEDKIIIEIKSVLSMPKVFEKQLYYYLRGTDYKVGYLVNFGNEKIDVRRRVYDLARIR